MRIDLYLFECGLAKSRTHASNLIKCNRVFLRGQAITKPAFEVLAGDEPEVIEEGFYSLGGCKLQKAIDDFGIKLEGKTVLDAGCANGGFTGVLLEANASFVYAVDVGANMLPEAIKNNARLEFFNKNVRYLQPTDFSRHLDFIAADLSFISLKLVLPVFRTLLGEKGAICVLIKPQFEAGKKALSKSGIVLDKKVREVVLKDISAFATAIGFKVVGITEAPHPFANKNQEYLLYAIL